VTCSTWNNRRMRELVQARHVALGQGPGVYQEGPGPEASPRFETSRLREGTDLGLRSIRSTWNIPGGLHPLKHKSKLKRGNPVHPSGAKIVRLGTLEQGRRRTAGRGQVQELEAPFASDN
jgi:hypothetical protein